MYPNYTYYKLSKSEINVIVYEAVQEGYLFGQLVTH